MRVIFCRGPDGELIELLEDKTGYTLGMDANDPCRSAYLPSSKSRMGLARIDRANPLLVQTLDVVEAFATAAVSPFLHLIPHTSRNLGGPNLLCTRSDVDVKAWAVGD